MEMWWTLHWIVLILKLNRSDSQLELLPKAVCVGEQVVFVCQHPGSALRWTVDLPGGMSNELSNSASSSQAGRVLTFADDPGFGFEIHVLSSSSASSVISELHVSAVSQLNGVTVECVGTSGIFRSTIQIASFAALTVTKVITTADQSQFTPSTASITLTWSASSGADNYTIMVTPLLPSGQSLVSTTTTSLQLTVLYNEEYSINITAHNCAGSNSTTVPLIIVGCSPPSSLTNGSINEYSSGAVGAMLTFQCDTGYMPQDEVTSTCLSNNSWIPTPKCEEIYCSNGYLSSPKLVADPLKYAKLGAVITIHCKGSNDSITAVCGNSSEWIPNPDLLNCSYGMVMVSESESVHESSNPNLSGILKDDHHSPSPAGLYVGVSVAVTVLFILLTTLIIILTVKIKEGAKKKKQSFNLGSFEVFESEVNQQYALTKHIGPRVRCQSSSGRSDTLIYADLGPSSVKGCTPVMPVIQDDHKVVYSTVNHALQQGIKMRRSDNACSPDAALDLDILLIQLKPQVLSKWKLFAEAVGLSNLIKELSQYSEDECIVEVFDQWLKSHPTKPTWRNVADVLNDIGLQQLAQDIMKVYQTGQLPIVVDMDAVPEKAISDTETPPPLPPKIDEDLVPPNRPLKPVTRHT